MDDLNQVLTHFSDKGFGKGGIKKNILKTQFLNFTFIGNICLITYSKYVYQHLQVHIVTKYNYTIFFMVVLNLKAYSQFRSLIENLCTTKY